MARRKKDTSTHEPNIFKFGLTIGLSAVAGHAAGRVLRPRLLPYLGEEAMSSSSEAASTQAAAEAMVEDGDFDLMDAARQIMPGIAVALFVRNFLGARLAPLGGAAFLGSFVLTVIADTKYDEKARSVIKTVAPGGRFLV